MEQTTKPDVGQNNDAEGASKEEMVQILINCNQDISAIRELLTVANYEERFRRIEVDFTCAVTEVFDKKVKSCEINFSIHFLIFSKL